MATHGTTNVKLTQTVAQKAVRNAGHRQRLVFFTFGSLTQVLVQKRRSQQPTLNA